ncbi:Periplasmic component of amino acid ABC-type transporter/signal transduction system precursor [Novosphingobium resinovorum]|uniref:Periplasmic component of amino acid ABC-type transporter/signal transduction system n=1 Tax=Novosphingobium resinovorum TaxID=158500 RepID=A0A031JLS0_9SPHN|nr:amino acid ABC transporter substrate-binding protein [Novosphingobium resinovorum]EZP76627.1 Periplasmic component of amino acid ABC-type transporter/signal transduction system precursor [Novosphingobium resinovorum]
MTVARAFLSLACLVAGSVLLGACSEGPATPAAGGPTLAEVRARGYVRCGAGKDTTGFSAPDSHGRWRGLDVDTCRAIAVAALGSRDKARFVPLTGQQRITALLTGEIDVLPRTTTWTLQRDAGGINFTIPNYYDYTAFMIGADSGARTLRDLDGATVCVQTGSLTEIVFADVARRTHVTMHPVIFDNVQSTRQAFLAGRCDALATNQSALIALRAMKPKHRFAIIPASDDIAPLTPAVRHGDDQWFDIVKFSIEAMIVAEHLGINRANVEGMRGSRDPVIRRFLGVEPGNGRALGLRDDFAYQIVRQVGNYAEVYDANLGAGTGLNIPRGPNRLRRDGGLMLPIGFY